LGDHPKVDLSYASKYNKYVQIQNQGTGQAAFSAVSQTDVKVCYSTEALKYAQTAYFIAIVVV